MFASSTRELAPLPAICGATLVDPGTGEVRPDTDLHLQGHRIAGVAPAGDPPGGAFDARGLYAIPGLIDAHVHALGPLVGEIPTPLDLRWVFRQQRRNLAAYLRAGVTTIRDMAAPLKLVRSLSRAAARFEIPAPRLLYAGPMVTVPGGYPHYFKPMPAPLRLLVGPLRVDLRATAHARRVVEELAAAGVQCIKLAYQSMQYDDARTPLPALTPALIRAVAEEAHRLCLPVAMHQVYRRDLRVLLDLPFDTLEHTPIDGPLEDSDVAALARRPLAVGTTLSAYGYLDQVSELRRVVESEPLRFEAKPRRFVRELAASLERGVVPSDQFGPEMVRTGAKWMRHNLRRLSEAGLPVFMGSDSGIGPGLPGCPDWELAQLVRAGFTPLEALRAATVGPPASWVDRIWGGSRPAPRPTWCCCGPIRWRTWQPCGRWWRSFETVAWCTRPRRRRQAPRRSPPEAGSCDQ